MSVSSSALHSTRVKAYRLVCLPVSLVFIVASVLFMRDGEVAGYSTLLGGAAWLLPSLYFVGTIFAKVKPPTQILWTFYRAEVLKLFFSAILFVLLIKYLPIDRVALLLGYIAAQLTFLFMPLMPILSMRTKQR